MLCETRCSLSHWQGHRLTLLCILDCAAHLLPMPEEVETSFLNQTIKVFTKVSINIRCQLNILRCVFCMHESVSSALSRLTVPQWRTSLCTRPWKQSWLPFFISCVTELWRRATTPDPASTGPLWHEEDSQTGVSALISGHYCILSQFLISDTAANLLVFQDMRRRCHLKV